MFADVSCINCHINVAQLAACRNSRTCTPQARAYRNEIIHISGTGAKIQVRNVRSVTVRGLVSPPHDMHPCVDRQWRIG